MVLFLGDNSEKMVVLCDDEVEYPWKELLKCHIFIDSAQWLSLFS